MVIEILNNTAVKHIPLQTQAKAPATKALKTIVPKGQFHTHFPPLGVGVVKTGVKGDGVYCV